MHSAFLIKPIADEWRRPGTPQFDASHAFGLPGLDCPSCTPWAMTGLQYPSARHDLLRQKLGMLEPWSVSISEFDAIRQQLALLVDSEYVIAPGAQFGPLRGQVSGVAADFAWPNPWTALVREGVLRKIKNAGFSLTSAPAQLQFEESNHEPLIEIEAVPRVSLASFVLPDKCQICGRRGVSAPNPLVLERATFDDSIPIQRIAELPTFLVITLPLADFLVAQNFSGFSLDQLKFADH